MTGSRVLAAAARAAGPSTRQTSAARGQRGLKRQPGGRLTGLGGSPTTASRSVACPGARRGTARSSACVYGWRAFEKSSSPAAELDDAPEVHDGHAVADVAHDRHVVRDEQHRQAEPLAQVGEQVEHRRLHGDVERRDGLVGDQDLGLERERARDRDALALAARELARVRVERARREARRGRAARGSARRRRCAARACARAAARPSAWCTVMRGLSDEYGILEDHLQRAAGRRPCAWRAARGPRRAPRPPVGS